MSTFQLGRRHELPLLRRIQELESPHKGRIQSKSGFLGEFAKHSDRQLVLHGCLHVCPQKSSIRQTLDEEFPTARQRQMNNGGRLNRKTLNAQIRFLCTMKQS